MNPSETVQAAQRLLAEREAVGLKKYGTTVDRTDLEAGDWLQHAIEEASDLLLYLIRLQQTMQPAPAAAPSGQEPLRQPRDEGMYQRSEAWRSVCRLLDECVPGWLPLNAADTAENMALSAIRKLAASQLAPAAAPEDAQRAAYLARWKDAPEWAEWLAQDFDGRCDFWEVEPSLFAEAEWVSSDGEPLHTDRKTAENLLGSVRCEPRPVQGVGP